VVLVTEKKDATMEELREKMKKLGVANVAIPRDLTIMEIPVLGTGKIDYPKLQKMVEAEIEKDK
jgi:acyl-[acyl-carrier-protein]-phospholipid O-acyltransferase/long-chain-fatty-acid--[acyl-carrier-protein] ligase